MAEQVYLSEGRLVTDDGPVDLEALDRSDVEAISQAAVGATVSQTTAGVITTRWLAFIRDCGSASPDHASFQYLGGDVTDVFVIPTTDDVLWIGADWFDGTTVSASTDLYEGDALPVRNGAVQETTPGTFAVQFHKVGSTGIWLDAVADGGAASGRIWWPLCIVNDGGTMRVGCLLVDPSIGPYGTIEASHIVTLNGLGGYASHVNVGITGFEIDGMWRDTSHTYIVDERTVAGVLGSKHIRLARVANGSLATVASWQFWDGTAWVSSPAASAPLVDSVGDTIVGDADIAKIGTGHYMLVNHFPVGGSHLDVYRSTVPQGPWERYVRVPLAGSIGGKPNGGLQIAQIPRILDSGCLAGSEAPPAEHSMVMMSRNLLGPTDVFTARNIRRYAPQFVVVPWY